MEKLGRVENIQNNMAEIKVHRDSACGDNCAACGLCPNHEMSVTLPTVPELRIGDEVKLISDNSSFVKKTILGYLSLTLLLLFGGILGSFFGGEWLSFLFAMVFLGIGILFIRRLCPKGVEIHIEILTR